MIKLRWSLSKILLWTWKQPFAIYFLLARCNVCSVKSWCKRKDTITGNLFIVVDLSLMVCFSVWSTRMHERKWSARRRIGLFFQKVMSPGLSRNIKSFLLCFSEADGDRKSSMACVPLGTQGLKNKQELSPYALFKNHYHLLVKGTSLRLPLVFKRPLV